MGLLTPFEMALVIAIAIYSVYAVIDLFRNRLI